MNRFSLENKVAIVTGACGLLGRQHCQAFVEAGASVIVADLDEDKCNDLAGKLGKYHMPVKIDVTKKESIIEASKRIMEKFNRIDILVNNAAVNDHFDDNSGALSQSMFENYPLEMWNKSWEVNVTGIFLCSQIFGSQMLQQKKGNIINIASTYGIVSPDQTIYKNQIGEQVFFKTPSYPVTKSAVIGFTKFLAAYWGNKNIRVNALSPGGVLNGQDDFFIKNYSSRTPLGRMATADDYKGALVFLASDASSYMSGANLVVDGGWTII